MVKKALAVKLFAKPEKEAEAEAFLMSALELVNAEPLTVSWYALKFNENTFGIFDTFDSDEGRDAHLHGKIAEALIAKAPDLFLEDPDIERAEILAAKIAKPKAGSSIA